MILVDWQIKQAIEEDQIMCNPYDPDLINPNSLDIRLDSKFKYYNRYQHTPINPNNERDVKLGLTEKTGSITLNPGKSVLGSSVEKITLPDNLCAELNGKSSLARLGLQIHQTGGWIDCGFSGQITLELYNAGERPIKLIPEMPIGQLVFHQTEKAEKPYNVRKSSKYMNQDGPVECRYFMNSR